MGDKKEHLNDVVNDPDSSGFMQKTRAIFDAPKSGIVKAVSYVALAGYFVYKLFSPDYDTNTKNQFPIEWAGKAHAGDLAEASVPKTLPDLSDYTELKNKEKQRDYFDNILGKETTLRRFENGKKRVILYQFPNGKIWGFATKDFETGQRQWHWDFENDGVFEQSGKNFTVNTTKYGYD